MKKFFIGALILIIIMIVGALAYYKISLEAVSSESKEVVIEIPENSGSQGIAKILKENDLIKNEKTFQIYCKLFRKVNMKAGKYKLNKNMDVKKIVEELESGNVYSEEITITFIEGKNMRWIAKTIAENTENTEEDVYNLLQDEEYLDSLIENYDFINEDIKNEDIYYSLEGYLFPDTYTFENKKVSVKTIFNIMLNKMQSVINEYKMEIESLNLTPHQALTMASILELEGLTSEDRANIARVFYNRLEANMPLQSDVTTYYGLKIDMGERELTTSEINESNAYNTRSYKSAGMIPVGPICCPSRSSIQAAVNPSTDEEVKDAIYFVADKNGKLYFSKTNSEHEQTIKKLKANDLWYNY